ncbi:MAG: hypothetical protein JWQ19_3460 [Subtercola sp.]|nr:hypothetical protein [Subtercola sp.]
MNDEHATPDSSAPAPIVPPPPPPYLEAPSPAPYVAGPPSSAPYVAAPPSPAPYLIAPPAPGAPAGIRPLNVLAVISLVSAFFVSVAAVVTGHIALSQIKRRTAQGRPEQGRGLAVAGLVIGYVGVAAGIAGLCVVLVVALSGGFRALPGISALAPAPDLTFEAGQSLDPTSDIAFTDDFSHQPGFTESKKDWGDGDSQYTSADGKCTVDFSKTPLNSVQVVKGDDQATSDNLLAMLQNASYSDVAKFADSGALIQGSLYSSSTVDVRTMGWSGADGTQGATVARAFTALDYGLAVQISCADDASMQTASRDVWASAVIATQ